MKKIIFFYPKKTMNQETTLQIMIPPTENLDDLWTISVSSEPSFFSPELENPHDYLFLDIDFPVYEDYRPPPSIFLKPMESPESSPVLELEDDQSIFNFEG